MLLFYLRVKAEVVKLAYRRIDGGFVAVDYYGLIVERGQVLYARAVERGVYAPYTAGTVYAGNDQNSHFKFSFHIFFVRSLKAFPTTQTELKLIAKPAIIGLKSSPNAGYSAPAAMGMPITL